MAKVLVEQDQIDQLGVIADEQKARLDTVYTLLQDLKAQIEQFNGSTPDEVDLSPLLDKANAIDDEIGTMTPVPVPTTTPVTDPTTDAGAPPTDAPVDSAATGATDPNPQTIPVS